MIDAHQHFWQLGRFDYPWMSDCALESFGPDRIMFGSDYPVCLLAASYDRVRTHVFNLHGETVTVERIVKFINAEVSNDLITFGGPPIPIAAAMDDSAIRRLMNDLPSTPLEIGMRETMDRFAALLDAGWLDTSDLTS